MPGVRIARAALVAALAFFLVAGLNFAIGLIAIRTKSIMGILRAKYFVLELLSGLLIPTTLFPQPFRSLVLASPFPHINFTPATLYLGKATGAAAARMLSRLVLVMGVAPIFVVFGAIVRICSCIHRSPGPIFSSAGMVTPRDCSQNI